MLWIPDFTGGTHAVLTRDPCSADYLPDVPLLSEQRCLKWLLSRHTHLPSILWRFSLTWYRPGDGSIIVLPLYHCTAVRSLYRSQTTVSLSDHYIAIKWLAPSDHLRQHTTFHADHLHLKITFAFGSLVLSYQFSIPLAFAFTPLSRSDHVFRQITFVSDKRRLQLTWLWLSNGLRWPSLITTECCW